MLEVSDNTFLKSHLKVKKKEVDQKLGHASEDEKSTKKKTFEPLEVINDEEIEEV